MQEEANKQKRITLKTIHQMLDGMSVEQDSKCPKFEVIANLEVESVVNTFAVIIHLKLSHYGNDRLRVSTQ